METITFNNNQYQIPTCWQDVTVKMLIDAAQLSELLEDAPIIAIIAAYTGIPLREIRLDKSGEIQKVMTIMDFISKPYEAQPKTSFVHRDVQYSCADDLLHQNFEDWVSVQTALYNNREQQEKALPRLIAILCKKEGETLDDFDLNERSAIMESLPMTDAKDIEGFFLHSLNAYRSLILLSSTIKEQEALVFNKVRELQNILKTRKAHSGMFSGTRLRIGIYQLQLWWVRKVLEKYFNSEPSKSSKKTLKQTFRTLLTKKHDKGKNNGNSNGTL